MASVYAAAHDVAVNLLDPNSVVRAFGLAGIFVILFAETGLLIGFFLPGDTLLALAGAFAAAPVSDPRHLPLAALLVGCPVAAIVGAQVGHLIGARAGSRLFTRPDSTFFRHENLDRAEKLFNRFGAGWAVILARFIPVLRTVLNPVAGALEMPAKRFFVWNLIGGILWPVGILLAGYWVGDQLNIERYVLPIVGAAVVLTVASIGFEYLRQRRRRRSGSRTDGEGVPDGDQLTDRAALTDESALSEGGAAAEGHASPRSASE